MKRIIKVLGLTLMLTACSLNGNSSSSSVSNLNSISSFLSDTSIESSSILESESSNVLNESSSQRIDYTKFDKNIIGTWYVHSNWMGILEINTQIVINEKYEAHIANLSFYYVGIYENFEDTALFETSDGGIKFIASSSEVGVLDWGIFDSVGNQDIGVARLEEHVSGIRYSYEGEKWPMPQIKEHLGTEKDLPIYEHDYYYLFTGYSQIYDDAAYCMIDLYGVNENAKENYSSLLTESGYVLDKKDSSFYIFYDEEKVYSIKLSQYDDNLCIFVYYYSTLYY